MDPNPSSSSFASITDREIAGSVARMRKDPYTEPQYSFGNRVQRQLWSVVWIVLYRPSPRIAHGWRAWLLRCFGGSWDRIAASIPPPECGRRGTEVRGHGHGRRRGGTLQPCANVSGVACHCVAGGICMRYNPRRQRPEISRRAVSYETGALRLGWGAGLCFARCDLGDGAILGLASVATKDLEPWSIYAGVPGAR